MEEDYDDREENFEIIEEIELEDEGENAGILQGIVFNWNSRVTNAKQIVQLYAVYKTAINCEINKVGLWLVGSGF